MLRRAADFLRGERSGCPHLGGVQEGVRPRAQQCEECGARMSLRVCMTCGHVGCCESQMAHNTQHARATGHAIIKPLPLGERSWTWCYECNAYV